MTATRGEEDVRGFYLFCDLTVHMHNGSRKIIRLKLDLHEKFQRTRMNGFTIQVINLKSYQFRYVIVKLVLLFLGGTLACLTGIILAYKIVC